MLFPRSTGSDGNAFFTYLNTYLFWWKHHNCLLFPFVCHLLSDVPREVVVIKITEALKKAREGWRSMTDASITLADKDGDPSRYQNMDQEGDNCGRYYP